MTLTRAIVMMNNKLSSIRHINYAPYIAEQTAGLNIKDYMVGEKYGNT